MARKFLYFIAFCIIVYLGGRLALQFYPEQLTRLSLTPGGKFEPQPERAAGAYADPQLWVARPGARGTDPTRWLPDGYQESAPPLDVAVFFVHPTTYIRKSHWNAPADDAEARRIAEIVVRTQASAFNRSPEIWAPRYRQATFGAFVSDQPAARAALDLAYRDVAQAFDAFVAAVPPDRPIVLAGHSQGSFHLKRLITERVKGTPIARRLVAVYAIGWLVDTQAELPVMGLPACAEPGQTGCVISFLSYADAADTAMMRGAYERFAAAPAAGRTSARYLCSNPLTGGIGGTAPASANRGATVPDARFETAALTPGLVGARCAEDGTLRIGEGPDMGPFVLPGGNYHVYDYALFWANLRTDFAQRVAAWKR